MTEELWYQLEGAYIGQIWFNENMKKMTLMDYNTLN